MRVIAKFLVVLAVVLMIAGVVPTTPNQPALAGNNDPVLVTSENLPAPYWGLQLSRMKENEFGYINAEHIYTDAKGFLSLAPQEVESNQITEPWYHLRFVKLTIVDPKEHTLSLDLAGFEGGFAEVDAAGNGPPLVTGNVGKSDGLSDSAWWRVVEIVDGKKPKAKKIGKDRYRTRLLQCQPGQKVWVSRRYFTANAENKKADATGFLYNATQVAREPMTDSMGKFLELTCDPGSPGEDVVGAVMNLDGVTANSFNAYPANEQKNPNGKPSVRLRFAITGQEPVAFLPKQYIIPYLSEMNSGEGGWMYNNFVSCKKDGELFVSDGSPRPFPFWDGGYDLPGIKVAVLDGEKDEVAVDLTDFPLGFGHKEEDGEEFDPARHRRRWLKVTKVIIGKAEFARVPSEKIFERLCDIPLAKEFWCRPAKIGIYREEKKFFGFTNRNILVSRAPFVCNQGPAASVVRQDEEKAKVSLANVTYRWREVAKPDPKTVFAVASFDYYAVPTSPAPGKGRGKK